MNNSILALVPTRREGTVAFNPETNGYYLGSVLPDNKEVGQNNFVISAILIDNCKPIPDEALLFDLELKKIFFAHELKGDRQLGGHYGLVRVIGGCRRFRKTFNHLMLAEVDGIDIDDYVWYLRKTKHLYCQV